MPHASSSREPSVSPISDPSQQASRSVNPSFVPYEPIAVSPFKHHLGVSQDVVVTRKVTANNTKTPFAISGDEYVQQLRAKQLKKKQEIEDKEKRKIAREMKKCKPALKKLTEKDVVDDDSNDNLPMLDKNVCQAC